MRFDKREFFKTPSASSLLDEATPRASEFFKDFSRAKKPGDFYREEPAGLSRVNPGQ
jgi:hypothetical protein